MKILLTTILFLPDHSAGTEILTYSTAKELQRLGHDVHVLTGFLGAADIADADRFDFYEYDGIPVTRFHHAAVPMGKQSDVLEMEYDNHLVGDWFKGYLEKLRPDIAHFFHLALLSSSLVDVCKKIGIPMVLTPTDFWYVCPLSQLRLADNSMCQGPDLSRINCIRHLDLITKPGVSVVRIMPDWLLSAIIWMLRKKWLPQQQFSFVKWVAERPAHLRERLDWVSRIMVPTRLMEGIFIRNGVDPALMNFAPFGLNLDYMTSPTLRTFTHSPLRVGYIGSLAEHKGVHILLQSFRQLSNETQVTLAVYGENKQSPDFVEELRAMTVDDERITFCGTFPNSMIGKILSSIDVLVVPSLWYENTPLVIYSAQAASCPVIASNLGGMSEVIQHGVNGLLFEAGDVTGLAEAIGSLAIDRQLLGTLSSGAIPPRSIEDYVRQVLEAYNDVV